MNLMLDHAIQFAKCEGFSKVQSLFDLDLKRIPKLPGAYVILAADGTSFVYPVGTSPVFYIGQTDDLQERLCEHRRVISLARDPDRRKPLHKRVWEYGAAFGACVSYIRTLEEQRAKDLEDRLQALFAKVHRSTPVANNSASYKRARKIIEED